MKIHFHGAAGGVTGSKHLVEVLGKRILLDCGMYQGRRKEADGLNRHLPFSPKEIDAVILSHAHIDHSGLLPLLAKNGYCGKIYCTPATADILEPMLLDSAHIQESDAQYFLRKKRLRKNAIFPIEPLYRKEDVEATLSMLVAKKRQEKFEIFPGIFSRFVNAGHVLGSAQILLEGEGRTLAFTGDLGRKNRKIIKDPERIVQADAIITESTYGGRKHEPIQETRKHLAEIIQDTCKKGGKLIIPSFALERSQEIIYDLHILFENGKIPTIPVFVDSPLTTKFTKIFSKNADIFNEKTKIFFTKRQKNPFSFENLKHTVSVEESKKLNSRPGPFIILSSSGMCEGGRIRHHLRNSLPNPNNTILIIGYQARDTLGRKLVERRKIVKIFDYLYPVRAQIKVLNGYSGHGDQDDLLENIQQIDALKKIFIVHGDPDQQQKLYERLREESKEWNISIPLPGECFSI
jgi:metallo-beta-lactamase family protein